MDKKIHAGKKKYHPRNIDKEEMSSKDNRKKTQKTKVRKKNEGKIVQVKYLRNVSLFVNEICDKKIIK